MVPEELAKENPKYAKKDVAMADDIIDPFQGLLLFKLGDTNNGFQEAVLACIAQDTSKQEILVFLHLFKKALTPKLQLTKKQEKFKEEAMASRVYTL